jgi:TolB-like protein
MKIAPMTAFLFLAVSGALATTQVKPKPAIYIVPANGFQMSLTAAMQKKRVPISVLADQRGAEYLLESAPIQVKTQTTGSKVARCLFADCIGIQDRSSVAVQLVDVKSEQIVWAYTVHKQRGGAMNDQSMAEAVAKHLKEYMQKHPLD